MIAVICLSVFKYCQRAHYKPLIKEAPLITSLLTHISLTDFCHHISQSIKLQWVLYIRQQIIAVIYLPVGSAVNNIILDTYLIDNLCRHLPPINKRTTLTLLTGLWRLLPDGFKCCQWFNYSRHLYLRVLSYNEFHIRQQIIAVIYPSRECCQ
jgi:hypothetical protein